MAPSFRTHLLALLVMSGCSPFTGAPPAAVGPLEWGEVRIVSGLDSFALRVELAESSQQRRRGLSERSEVPDDLGMFFVFEDEQPPGSAFWMHRTLVPLSLAFIDAEGVIREIHSMEPCRRRLSVVCPRYRSSVPFHYALEVAAGYFERWGIQVGDSLSLLRDRDARVLPPPRALGPSRQVLP